MSSSDDECISLEDLISKDIEKHTRPGLALKGARLKEGLTQIQLAEQLNVRQENLSKMENGKRSISPVMAKRLAKILHVDYRIFL
jgi:transcriptional regulator with XRE-family HTH domain